MCEVSVLPQLKALSKPLFIAQKAVRVLCWLLLSLAFWGLFSIGPAKTALATDLIDEIESQYNNIFVYRKSGRVIMTFGHSGRFYTESMYNPFDRLELPVRYTRYMTASVLYPPKLEKLLLIGLGGGRTSWYLHHYFPDLDVTAVELDPKVVEVAKRYFDIREEPGFQIATGDGRAYVMRHSEAVYDIIALDAYRGPFVPFHLLTTEFYALLESRLAPGGVVVQNIEPTTMLFDSALATMRQVFDQIDFYDAKGNVVAVAYDGEKRKLQDLQQKAQSLQQSKAFRHPLPQLLLERHDYTAPNAAKPLTDDFAPVNALRAIERHNVKWDE